MDKISFSEFKKLTNDQPIEYSFVHKKYKCTADFISKKFFCHKNYESEKIIMPKLMLSIETEFFRLGPNKFKTNSKSGVANFRIMSDEDLITIQENEDFEKEIQNE